MKKKWQAYKLAQIVQNQQSGWWTTGTVLVSMDEYMICQKH